MAGTDFWWLSPDEKRTYCYVELVHHEPLKDDDSPSSAFSNPRVYSTAYIDQWRNWNEIHNTNVYRSLKMWSDVSKQKELRGPFILDIDNEHGDLDDALRVARKTVRYIKLHCNIAAEDMRIFFTGHKGFNIEIRPRVLQIQGSIEEQIQRSAVKREQIIKGLQHGKKLGGGYLAVFVSGKVIFRDRISGEELRRGELEQKNINMVSGKGTVIDDIHKFVRLRDSFNEWIESTGKISRRKRELTEDELNESTIEEIIARSEKP